MQSLLAFAAPFAVLLPLAAERPADPREHAASAPRCEAAAAGEGAQAGDPAAFNPLTALHRMSVARQVRIEQRVVVRIAPQPVSSRQNLLAEMPARTGTRRFEERGKEKCVALDGIAGVQTGSGNRLVLFLRDRRMISVNLEKACRARDFYSGFYVEKNKDGRLCVERDKLQSRTGARCEVDMMRHLVEVRS